MEAFFKFSLLFIGYQLFKEKFQQLNLEHTANIVHYHISLWSLCWSWFSIKFIFSRMWLTSLSYIISLLGMHPAFVCQLIKWMLLISITSFPPYQSGYFCLYFRWNLLESNRGFPLTNNFFPSSNFVGQ